MNVDSFIGLFTPLPSVECFTARAQTESLALGSGCGFHECERERLDENVKKENH